jgi:hypothetical protein
MDLSFVKKLKMQSMHDILRSMVTQFERAGSENPIYPYVTVTMGAFSFSGIPVKIEMIRNENILAMISPERGVRGQDSISYIPLNAISSVSVDNFRHHLSAVATGIAPTVTGEAPTKLALERKLLETSGKVGKKISFVNLVAGAEEGLRASFDVLLKDVELVLNQLNGDPMGKEAVAAIADIQLMFSESEGLAVSMEGSTLKVTIGYSQSLDQLTADLHRLVEKAL